MDLVTLFIPSILVLLTAIGSVIALGSSQLIIADEGDYHLGNIPYLFKQHNYQAALLSGGTLGFLLLYIIPMTIYGEYIIHWLPITMISLFTAQSIIDLKYFELADEWTFLIGILAIMWRHMNGGLTWMHIGIALALYLFFFIGWFFVDFPGYGDVKIVLAAGVMISSWVQAYWFIFFITFIGSVGTLFGCWLDKKPVKEWLRTKFAFGPYIAIGFLLAMIGLF